MNVSQRRNAVVFFFDSDTRTAAARGKDSFLDGYFLASGCRDFGSPLCNEPRGTAGRKTDCQLSMHNGRELLLLSSDLFLAGYTLPYTIHTMIRD